MAVQKAESEEMYVLQMVQINENNKSDHELKLKLMFFVFFVFIGIVCLSNGASTIKY